MLALSLFVLIVVIVGLTLLFRFAVTRMGEAVGKVTHERHSAAEQIVEDGRVPQAWLEGEQRPPYAPEAGRRFVARLDSLIRYFGRAPVFDSDATRQALLEELRAARSRWQGGVWEAPEHDAAEGPARDEIADAGG